MSNGSDACEFHLKTDKFLRILYQQKHCHPVLRGTERRIHLGRQRYTGECHVKTEADTGAMHLQAKESKGLCKPPEVRKRQGRTLH